MYYKVISVLSKETTKLFFINNTNIDLILNEIYHKIIQQLNILIMVAPAFPTWMETFLYHLCA